MVSTDDAGVPMAAARLTIRVPNPLFKDWLTKHYSVVLSEALAEVRRPGAGLIFVSEGTVSAAPPSDAPVEVGDDCPRTRLPWPRPG